MLLLVIELSDNQKRVLNAEKNKLIDSNHNLKVSIIYTIFAHPFPYRNWINGWGYGPYFFEECLLTL